MTESRLATIVIADDDRDDRMLIEDAFRENRLANPRVYVEDGEQLLAHLRSTLVAAGDRSVPPALVLLDLNMPRLDGRGVLAKMKVDPDLRRIPVVVLTTSKAEEDILRTYDLGVNSFITKPVTYDALVQVVKVLKDYWIEISRLPPQ
ncbi:MAG: response regulator [Hyphomicrobiaceae bacterium]